MPPAEKQKPRLPTYREYLTPLLHRRYAGAFWPAIWLSYTLAVCLGSGTLTWRLCSFATIARTIALAGAAHLIFMLRVSSIGNSKFLASSKVLQLLGAVTRKETYLTYLAYSFSALLITQCYTWSSSKEADLRCSANTKYYESDRLNERAVLLWFTATVNAFIYATYHLTSDFDTLRIPLESLGVPLKALIGTGPLALIWPRNQEILGNVAISAVMTICGALAACAVYGLILRNVVFVSVQSVAQHICRIPKSTDTYSWPPFSVLYHAIICSVLLSLLWESANQLFTIYINQPPIKHGAVLSSNTTNPNSVLLNGLSSPKVLTKTFAIWELALVATSFPDRRKMLFSDLEGTNGPALSSILKQALSNIQLMSSAINNHQNPPKGPTNVQDLPRLTPHLDGTSITVESKPKSLAMTMWRAVHAYFNPTVERLDPVAPAATMLYNAGKRVFRPNVIPKDVLTNVQQKALPYLSTTPGRWFSLSYGLQTELIVLQDPAIDTNIVTGSIVAITAVLKASKSDDLYGTAWKEVAPVVRAYTQALQNISLLLQSAQVHWTDVASANMVKPEPSPHVDLIVKELKAGLKTLLDVFQKYGIDVGLSSQDIRIANKMML